MNSKVNLMGAKEAFSNKDEDKTREELVNELETLRSHYSRLKAMVQRYESAASKKDVLGGLNDLEAERDRINALRDKLRKKHDESNLESEELEARKEELNVGLEELHAHEEAARVKEAQWEEEARCKVAAAVEVERKRFFDILENLPVFLYLQDGNHSIRYVNQKFRKIFGEPQNRPCYEVIQCHDAPCPDCPTFKVFDTFQPQLWEWTDKSGNIYQIFDYPFRDVDGTSLVLEMGIDITEQKRADEEISRLASIVTSSDDAIIGKTLDGIITSWNISAERLYGYSAAEAVGKHIRIIVPPDHMPELNEILDRIRRGERIEHYETVRVTKDGRRIDVSITISPIIDASGNMIGASTIARDITERKRAGEALKLTQFAIDNFNDSSIWLSPEGRLVYVNEMTLNWLGYSREELLSMYIWEIDPDYTPDRFHHVWQELRQKGTLKFESMHRRRNGCVFPVEVRASLIKYGNKEYFISFDRDITERKHAEEALRESEDKFHALADNIPVMAWMANVDGRIFWYNKQCYDYAGTTLEEMQGWGWQKSVHPDYVKAVTEEWSASIKEGKPFYNIFPMRGKDGNYCWFLTRVTPIKDKNGKIQQWFGTNTDITERKRAEEELRASEEKFRALADTSFDTIMVHRGDNLLYVNNPAVGLTGYSKDEILKMQFWELFTEDARETIKKRAFDRLAGRSAPTSYETRILTKDGQTRWINMTAGIFLFEGKLTIIATLFDITGIKNTEKELKEAKAQAELYLDLMGHDIRNMNQVSMGYLEFALESPNIDKKDKELLLKTMGGLENSTRLIDNVRKLQKSQTGELKLHAVDACQVILRVLGHYSNIPDVDATFNYELPPGCTVMANDLLYEVFENLVGNAIKHAGTEPTINIKYETTVLNDRNYNKFMVEDNGPGIRDDLKPNIFNRRIHSGAKTRGSGLGLFIVKSLVDSYGGRVWVEDRVQGDYSKGARFVVLLPVF